MTTNRKTFFEEKAQRDELREWMVAIAKVLAQIAALFSALRG